MTDPERRGTLDAVADATVCAARAAAAAGVTIRELTDLAELSGVISLYEEIWRPTASPPVSTELLRAMSKAGNYVAAAFDGAKLVGACVGFFTAPVAGALHSHVAGVSATVAGRHVGFALKLHQRAWTLRHGVGVIEWTFDPLVARNAFFNIGKLGGRPAEYLPNFYGDMDDGINGDDDTDRLLLHWDLDSPKVNAACAGVSQGADRRALGRAAVALDRSEHGGPVAGQSDDALVLVAVPTDVERLRTSDPGQAREWRAAVREVLGGLLADGARVIGFDRDGWYVVQR
jgi:predicted GNAT superfamily acetyltransferase